MSQAAARVLLVCSGNTCRSPMATALLRQVIAQEWPEQLGGVEVTSAGTGAVPDMPASEEARAVMARRGLDLSGHRSRRLTADMVRQATLILTMTRGHLREILRLVPEARGKVFLLKYYPAGDEEPGPEHEVEDPVFQGLGKYEEVAADLEAAVRRVAAYLAEQDP
ncbi:MAG TPA: low molecular weight protein arginine phosphatase [Firmicutes bacterium]|nr:low molecular weight protein arginine phosphatase [Bacillota bacterium]